MAEGGVGGDVIGMGYGVEVWTRGKLSNRYLCAE